MLKFKDDTNFDKLFINTNYVFDVIFWTDTEWINDIKGNKLHLRNVVATQYNENDNVSILLNVAENKDSCNAYQKSIECFENGSKIKQQILDFVKANIKEIKYTIKDKILDIQEVKEGIRSLLDSHIGNIDSLKIYNRIRNINETPFNLQLDNGIKFENNIYYAKDKDCYLLESRLFNDNQGGLMIDAYLMIINSDMTLVKGYTDDVWEYADFSE